MGSGLEQEIGGGKERKEERERENVDGLASKGNGVFSDGAAATVFARGEDCTKTSRSKLRCEKHGAGLALLDPSQGVHL